MKRADVADIYALSPTQEGMLFESLRAEAAGVYFEQLCCTLSGGLDAALLEAAWQRVVDRHPILRTAFFWRGLAQPHQVVKKSVRVPWRHLDWRRLDAAERRGKTAELLRRDVEEGFDLGKPPLLRFTLARLEEDRSLFVWSFHHLLLDGWSVQLVLGEVLAVYHALAAGRAPRLEARRPFRDYVAWLERRDLAEAESFWRRELEGVALPDVLPASDGGSRGAAGGGAFGELELRLAGEGEESIRRAARRHKVTPASFLQGAWAVLLCRYAASDEVVLGVTVSGRAGDLAGLESMVGMFINTLPMRVRMPARRPISESLAGLQALATETRSFEHTPLVQAHTWSGVSRDRPLFETLFVYENYPAARGEGGGAGGSGVGIADMRLAEQPNYPVSLVVAPAPGEIVFRFRYLRSRLGDTAARRMLGHLETVLGELAAADDPRPADLGLLTGVERRQLAEWNASGRDHGHAAGRLLHELVSDRARAVPDAVAVVAGGKHLSFAHLLRRARRLAGRLRRLGVGPDSIVPVHLERSAERLVALLGVLEAGGAYLPLEPELPAERLGWMIGDGGARAVVTSRRLAPGLPEGAFTLVFVSDPAGAPRSEPSRARRADPGQAAYVIFTSGSTGRPKGVVVSHRAIVNRLLWMGDRYRFGAGDRVLQKTPFGFDVSVWELFLPLIAGSCLVIARPGGHRDPAYLEAEMRRERVSVLHFVPSMLAAFLDAADPGGCPALRVVISSGEALPRELARAFLERSGAELHNLYGPTEAAVDVTAWPCRRDAAGPVPIGRPIANLAIHLLDQELRPVPVGIAGELWIGGVGLARGYLGRPALTAERFVPDPSGGATGGRLYRTGDLARYRSGGEIEYLGRRDHQVKIRGLRIELGEIESALSEQPEVGEAVVLVRGGEGAGPVLAAYVTGVGEGGPDLDSLRAALSRTLPEYMVPGVVVVLPRLPITANGKVDRAALASIEPSRSASPESARSETPTEGILAALWGELLGADEVVPGDDFFALGGHSLLAMRLVSRVRSVFEVELEPGEVFDHPSLESLARRIDGLRWEDAGLEIPLLERRPRPEEIPLSFSQERLWFLQQLDPGSAAAFNVRFDLHLDGPLVADAFAQAVGEVVRRHEALRTRFEAVAGRPVQRVEPAVEVPLPVVDLGGLAEADRPRELAVLARRRARRGFDLAAAPLLSLTLVRLAAREHAVLAAMHHIVSDDWSRGILAREVGALYEALREGRPSPLPELGLQYADFALWQRGWLRGEALEAELDFWRERFAGAPEGIELPLDRPHPPVRSLRGGRRRHALPPGAKAGLAALAARHGATLYMTLLAAFAALLHRYSGQRDLLVGSPVANRTESELEGLVGFFVNTLVLRVDLGDAPTFRELLARVRRVCLEAYAHRHLPFEQLVEALEPERDLSHNPLFQVLFVFQAAGLPEVEPGELSIRPLSAGQETSMFDLVLSLAEEGDRLAVVADFSRDLFDGTTVARALAHLETLLASAIEAPERPLSELDLLTPPEVQQLLREWNGEPEEAPGPRLLHELVSEHVRARPEAVAVVDGGTHVSYGALGTVTTALARRLVAEGTVPGDLVGVLARRGLEQVASVAGVLAAGAGFLPLDPDHPPERLRGTLSDAGARAVLVAGGLAYEPGPEGPPALRPEIAWNGGPPAAGGARLRDPHPDHPAYAIYTSGSTGRPKGVVVPHRGVVDTLLWRRRRFGVGAGDRILATVPPTFDPSVWQTFGALGNGACLVLAPPDAGRDAAGLARLLVREAITITDFPPSLLDVLLDEEGIEAPALAHLFCGGEALPRRVVERFAGRSAARLHNMYGPTETSIDAASWTCLPGAGGRSVPIGRPIGGKRLHVLDPAMRLLPAGVAGELWIGGAGLSRGYAGRPAETAASFLPDPFSSSPGRRLYRSGDFVRHRAGGELEFLGRADEQVKIRGFRVELGEVEAALAGHPEVAEAVVVLGEGPAGEGALVGYAGAGRGVAPEELSGFLRRRLPGYMVPAALVVLDALPRNPNGKVDRSALPPPAWASRAEHVEPEGPVEESLAALWRDLLGRDRVGREDGFFELGGHSLLATRLASRVRSELGVELPVRRIFEAPRLRELAAEVRRLRSLGGAVGEEGAPPPLVPVPRDEPPPLSFGQQRLWFLHQLSPESADYHVASARRIGAEAPPLLEAALTEIVRRHEVLRTAFPAVDGEPVQAIAPPRALRLPVVDLRGISGTAREREGARLGRGLARRPFDLEAEPPLRLALLLDGGAPLLRATLHHIVGDGWSAAILGRETSALLAAYRDGRPSPLDEAPVQYADFAHWQRRWLSGAVLEAEVGYWRRRLEGLPPALELPTDRPRPAVAAPRGARRAVPPAPGLGAGVERLAREHEATPFMLLLAAVGALLSRLSGELDLAVGSPIAGRTRSEVEGLIGFFVNTLVLRVELAGRPSFVELLERVRETALGAYAHQHLPFEKLVEELDPERSLARTPVFQVMLGYDGAEGAAASPAPAASGATSAEEVGAGKFDLTFSLAARPGGELTGQVSYDAGLFDTSTVARWTRSLEALLRAAVEAPETPVAELPLLGAAERHQVAREWSGSESPASTAAPFPQLFLAWAGRTPDAVAVVHEEQRLSYGELARRAAGLARALSTALASVRGAGAEVPVAVCLERSPGMIVAILASHLAGAPYVPLDPEQPPARRAFCLADSGAAVLVTRRALAADLPEWRGASLFVEEGEAGAAEGGGALRPDAGGRERLAYVIYTSGSTGRPKGVAVSHGQLASYLAAIDSRLGEPAAPSFATVSTVAADLGNTGIFLALGRGGTLHVVSESRSRDGRRFASYFAARPVDGLKIVPSHLAALLAGPGAAGALPLRWLVLGGETPGRELLARLGSLGAGSAGGCRVLNHYGPTETTVEVAAHELPAGLVTGPGPVPMGRPLADSRVLVLDPGLGPSPVGVPGELGLGGPQVARGYLGRPRETAERFVPSPWGGAPGERIYRSGDRGRFRADGTIEFLGRIDDQVKVRGHRVEPAEVASALAAHPAVAEAVVVGRADPAGETRLVAYLVTDPAADGGSTPWSAKRSAALREHLAARLPGAMIPALFVPLPALPLNANGKLDRRALPEPEWGRRDGTAAGEGAVAPRGPAEAELVRLWEELLEVRPIGVRDDFFALGGHSLLAVRLRARVEAVFGREVPLVELLRHPTVESLARWLAHGDAADGEDALPRGLVPLATAGGGRPLFLVHEAGGSVAGYRALAARLAGVRPVYGIEADASPEGGAHGSVEAMAAAYLDAVRAVEPEGPWLLGGWSFGGLVAFEMARRLEAAGEPVGAVFLLDTPPPGDGEGVEEPSLSRVLAFFAGEAGLAVDRDELEEADPEVAVRRVAEVAVAAGLLPASGAEEYLRHRLDLLGRNLSASARYRVDAPIDAPVVYLRTTAEDPRETAGGGDPTRGWSRRSRRPVRLHLLPGDHWSFLSEPEVAEVARLLEEAVVESATSNPSTSTEPVLQES